MITKQYGIAGGQTLAIEKATENRKNGCGPGKVSIIVPVYNAEAFLDRCMQSLLGQTYQNTEIILIDDGSTDSSGRMCDRLAGENEIIRVIHIEEKGVSAARNLGITQSTGDYLTFVDADDCPAADMVEHLVWILERTDSDVAGCSYREFYNDGEAAAVRKSRCEKDPIIEILEGKEFIAEGILKSDTRCWSKLYKKQILENHYFDTELTIGEDMIFLLGLAQTGSRFGRSDYKGYGYFINNSGAMMRSFRDSYMDQIICWQKALSVISQETPEYADQAETILLISVMLVAGKLAMLSPKERKEKKQYIEKCSELVKRYAGKKKVFCGLDKGYKIKITLFRSFPYLYMRLYQSRNRRRLCRKIN